MNTDCTKIFMKKKLRIHLGIIIKNHSVYYTDNSRITFENIEKYYPIVHKKFKIIMDCYSYLISKYPSYKHLPIFFKPGHQRNLAPNYSNYSCHPPPYYVECV